MSQINLDSQVQNGPLDMKYGGTANVEGKAEGMYRRYFNRDAGVLSLGTLVSFRDVTESGSISVKKTNSVDAEVLGVVIGTFTLYGPDNGKYEFSAPSNDMEVAVLQYGRTSLLSIGSNGGVTRGMYAYSVGSNGQVYGDTRLHRGAIGVFLSNGSNGAAGAMCEIGRPFDLAPYGQRVSANVIIDGGGAVPTTGQKVTLFFDFAAVIDGWTALGDNTAGSCVVDIWKDTYANYLPNAADSITGSAPVSIPSNSSKNTSDNLTGWSPTINEGDALIFNLQTVQTFTRITVNLKLRRLT